MISFASDNNACVHPKVFEMLNKVNNDTAPAYGQDVWTAKAEEELCELFDTKVYTVFVQNGTGANVVALGALVEPYSSILTVPGAHIIVSECGAPVKFTGCQIDVVKDKQSKMTPEDIIPYLSHIGNVQKSQPSVISISQSSELGEVYSVDEIKALSDICKKHNIKVQIDGARLTNAIATFENPKKALRETLKYADVLVFGGTKNGLLGAEAVITTDPVIANRLNFARKQATQLSSKMRFVSSQFSAFLQDDLWLDMSKHSNTMLNRMYLGIKNCKNISFRSKIETNMMHLEIPSELVNTLRKEFYFYADKNKDDNNKSSVRIVTSWQTKTEDVDLFIKRINEAQA